MSRSIKLDNDKLDYIEGIISKNRMLEMLISNLIDFTIEKKEEQSMSCIVLIKAEQPDNFDKIMNAVNSIIYNYDLII